MAGLFFFFAGRVEVDLGVRVRPRIFFEHRPLTRSVVDYTRCLDSFYQIIDPRRSVDAPAAIREFHLCSRKHAASVLNRVSGSGKGPRAEADMRVPTDRGGSRSAWTERERERGGRILRGADRVPRCRCSLAGRHQRHSAVDNQEKKKSRPTPCPVDARNPSCGRG
jgi:hypothetical protein